MLILEPIFSDHMVFAANRPILIYGQSDSAVRVSLAGAAGTAMPQDSRWCVSLPAMDYGGPFVLKIENNTEVRQFEDVYMGDVYIMAGQSNMQLILSETNTEEKYLYDDDGLRLFETDRVEPGQKFHAADGFLPARKEDLPDWPAIPYLMGRAMRSKRDVRVGVIGCFQGASVIEAWLPRGTNDKLDIHIPREQMHSDHTDAYYGVWNGDGDLYEKQFRHIAPFRVSGVVWYQGESNSTVAEGKIYGKWLCELIDVWRRDLGDPDLPFVVIQIADYEGGCAGWPLVQQAQLEIGRHREHVRTVVCRDICEKDNIHPPTKRPLAERVAEALE